MTETHNARAIGYVRVSTEDQTQGHSQEAQEEAIRGYARLYDLELVDVVVDQVSGLRPMDSRPVAQAVLDRVRSGDVAHLVVWKLDRLSRRSLELMTVVEQTFAGGGAALHSVTERLDTSTPTGELVVTILAALAQMESKNIGMRTKLVMEKLKREKRRFTRFEPWGYRFEDGRMVEIPEEHALVNRIRDMRAAGESYRKIARQLNREGIPTKRGGRWGPGWVQFAERAPNVPHQERGAA